MKICFHIARSAENQKTGMCKASDRENWTKCPTGLRGGNYKINIPILPEAFLTFASKSCGPSHRANSEILNTVVVMGIQIPDQVTMTKHDAILDPVMMTRYDAMTYFLT